METLPKDLIASVSGIRGKSPEVLDISLMYRLVKSFAALLPPGPVVVSRDSRATGIALKRAALQALSDAGRAILDADLIPLPTTQMAIVLFRAAGGIDVTASHNPAEYNGLKCLDGEGHFISKDMMDKLIAGAEAVRLPSETTLSDIAKPHCEIETKSIQEEAIEHHKQAVLKLVERGRPLRVALDAVNGAGSCIVREFLEEAGCEVIPLAIDPTKPFPHTPEPTPVNLAWTCRELEKEMDRGGRFDFCAVVDPDADRLVLIDERAAVLSEEITLPLIVSEMIAAGKTGTVVINASTSMMTERIASKALSTDGMPLVRVVRSPVGEANVVAWMQKENAIFGGEGGGGIIDPAVHYGRDSLAGIAYVMNHLRRTGKKLSEIAQGLDTFFMKKIKVPLAGAGGMAALPAIYAALKRRFPDAKANTDDGLRLSWPDKWVHVRPSNTEPILRIIAEASNPAMLERMVEEAQACVA